ncbi:hypothetical protein KSS87_019814, partial [Heliosperma pusillum]
MSFVTIILLLLSLIPPFQWRTEAIICVRTCGTLSVSYPFGFSSDCEFPLTCLTNKTMEFKGYTIRNITWETMSLNFPAKCNRSIAELGQFFGENYALTTQNGLLLRNCSSKTTAFNGGGCLVSPNLVEKRFGVKNCDSKRSSNSIVNVKCFGVNNGGGNLSSSVLSYEDVSKNGCVNLLSSIVVFNDDGIGGDGGGGSDVSIEFQTVQVMWWVNGTCSCDPNAVCNRVGSNGFQCQCNPGFSGDGFVDGRGCRNASESDAVGGYKTAILIGGIVAGASSTIILAAICYLCIRRTTYMRSQVSARRLLFEAAGNSTVPMYPYREIERATSGFSEKQQLGTGAYGTVYAGKFHNNEYVAIKKLKHRDTDSIDQIMNEIKLLSSVSHPNLVRLLGCCIE